jgi:hypothetical protein
MGYLKYWYDLADLAAGRMAILVEKGPPALRSGTAPQPKKVKRITREHC